MYSISYHGMPFARAAVRTNEDPMRCCKSVPIFSLDSFTDFIAHSQNAEKIGGRDETLSY
jgi:hypothetical protein